MLFFKVFIYFMILILLFLMNMINLMKNIYINKLSPYECSFNPIINKRFNLNLQFYLISIMFLIFDMEIMIFIPFIKSSNIFNFNYIMILNFIFFMFLILSLIIEWMNNSIKWML